jgi:hypothetical protein
MWAEGAFGLRVPGLEAWSATCLIILLYNVVKALVLLLRPKQWYLQVRDPNTKCAIGFENIGASISLFFVTFFLALP